MLKSAALFVLSVLAVTNLGAGEFVKIQPKKTVITPYSLWDQAAAQLRELNQVVDSAIYSAKIEFDEIQSSYTTSAQNTQDTTEGEIFEEAQKNDGYVNDIKDLANSVNVNINFCLRGREDYLNTLPDVIVRDLQLCILNVNSEVSLAVAGGVAAANKNYDVIRDLTDQLNACVTGSIICVSPVVRDISDAMIKLPENIELQVHATRDDVNTLSLQVDECASSQRSTYVTSANTIINDLENCVNTLL